MTSFVHESKFRNLEFYINHIVVKKISSLFLTVVFYFMFGTLLLIFHPIQLLSLKFLGYNSHKKSVDFLNFLVLKCLNFFGTRFQIINKHELPKDAPLIFVANHQSTYEIPPIIWYFRKHHPKFISKMELGRGIPSVSFNLQNGGSVLIDRKKTEESINKIKSFAQKVNRKKWSAVIFPEGTRSRDGNPKKFQRKGLMTLIENIPDGHVVPVSINNSWKFAKYKYFPLPIGVKLTFKLHPIITLSDGYEVSDLIDEIEKTVRSGVVVN